jgi:glycosyltransferase involved in cell wall biosynthesis
MLEKISVALPAHNEENTIFQTLTAVYESEFNNIPVEVYVCLSGCTDKTKEKIQEYIAQHPDTNVNILEGPIGKALALKHMDTVIENDIIVFMDSDCSPEKDAIYKVYKKLRDASDEIYIVSGNVLDSRYTNKSVMSTNLIESLNRIFWQRSERKIINGPLFACRKGRIQALPTGTISDDTLLSVIYWKNFDNEFDAIIKQGSAQSIYEIVRYRRNFVSAYKQINNYLKGDSEKQAIFYEMTKQFDINLFDKNKYWPNIPITHLLIGWILQKIGNVWGNLIKPTWSQTKSSKEIV